MAIAKSDKIAGQRMVAILQWQCFAHCKFMDNLKKFGAGLSAFFHLSDAFLETGGRLDGVLHENRNSSSFSGSLQYGALGSLATSFASLTAASNRVRFVSRESVNGIWPVARHFLKKQVMAVVMFMPMSSKKSSASAFRLSSIRIVSEVVIAKFLSFAKSECIVSKSECKYNAA